MECELDADTCRREHIAAWLTGIKPDGADFEARCPVCGHGGFRVSRPTRSRRLRNLWTCACGRCKGRCTPGVLRAGLLQLTIRAACLGIYDGANAREIPADVAQEMDRTINDILSMPGLKLQDVRLLLADAQGRKIPDDYTGLTLCSAGSGTPALRTRRPDDPHSRRGQGR